jgi:hypothetical protein
MIAVAKSRKDVRMTPSRRIDLGYIGINPHKVRYKC